MSPRRSTSRDRRLAAVSVLTAGALAASGSAAVAASAATTPTPAVPRDVLPAQPLDPVTAVLGLLAQLQSTTVPLLELLDAGDLGATVASLTDGQLGQLFTKLTGVELAAVLDGSALNRVLSAVTTLGTPQLLALLDTAADALRTLPAPAGVTIETVIRTVAGVLGRRDVAIPAQITSLLAQPPVAQAAAPAGVVLAAVRARISDAAVARDRRTARIDVSCPAVAASACRAVVRTTVAGRSAGAARRVTVSRGRSKVVRPRLSSSARARLSRGGTLRVEVRTTGSDRGPVRTAVRVPRAGRA